MPADPRTVGGTDPTSRLAARVTELERLLGVGKAGAVGWTDPTFAANWTEYDTTLYPVSFAKLANGLVILRGLTKKNVAPANGETMFTLPVGFRPAHQVNFPALAIDAFTGLRVLTTGEVQVRTLPAGFTTGSWFALDGATFRAEG